MRNPVIKIMIMITLFLTVHNMNILITNAPMPIIDVNSDYYSLDVTPGEVKLYEITSLQILQPDGNYSLQNTTLVSVGGKMKPLTLTLHDKIQVAILDINGTHIQLTEQYQIANGSTITCDPFYQDLGKVTFDSYIMTSNTSLIGDVINEAKLDTTTLSSSSVYFEDSDTLSNITGLTRGWGTRYELPKGWLESIIYETYNITQNPITYFKLEQYREPEPDDPLAVNPQSNTLGVTVGDEQILEIVKVESPELTDLQEGDRMKFIILNITQDTILISQQSLDRFGNIVDEFENEQNRSLLSPLQPILTTNITLIHEVFDDNPDYNTLYSDEFVTINFTFTLLSTALDVEMIFDLQTGWLVSYHIIMETESELTEIWMIAISELTTSITPSSTSTTTTEKTDPKPSTTTTTPRISSFPGIVTFLLLTLVVIKRRQ